MSRQGKGSLAKLEKLKAEHGPRFKQAAKQCKRGDECVKIRCVHATRYLVMGPSGLRLRGGYCKRKGCPRLLIPLYLEMLRRSRPYRRQDCQWTRQRWWEPIRARRDQIRKQIRGLRP
jgi:hypothetical protein